MVSLIPDFKNKPRHDGLAENQVFEIKTVTTLLVIDEISAFIGQKKAKSL